MIGASKLATPKAVMVSRNLTHRAVDEMTDHLQIIYDSKKESCHVNGIQFMKDQVWIIELCIVGWGYEECIVTNLMDQFSIFV